MRVHVRRNLFLQSLSEEEQESVGKDNDLDNVNNNSQAEIQDKDIVECFESDVQYWIDFSKVHYHPQSLYELSELWVDIQDFNNYGLEKEAFFGYQHGEEIDDRFCFFIEECDHIQGILSLRGRPAVAYDKQVLVFAVAMERGAIKFFDSRYYDKGPFETFLVGGDTAEVCDIKFSNDGKSMLLTTTSNSIYVLDAYGGEKWCGFILDPSLTAMEATFTPDGQYFVSNACSPCFLQKVENARALVPENIVEMLQRVEEGS